MFLKLGKCLEPWTKSINPKANTLAMGSETLLPLRDGPLLLHLLESEKMLPVEHQRLPNK